MKNTILATTAAVLVLGTAAPVLALDVDANVNGQVRAGGRDSAMRASSTVRVEANLASRIETAKDRAEREISRRIEALTHLGDKVGAMARVTADVKTSITATLQSQIATLTTLKAKIAADTDIDTLKADIKSITGSYRIFMLVVPQGHITAMADSIQTAATNLVTLSGKLETRINDAKAQGADVSSFTTLLADMKAKIASAQASASAASTLVAGLKPDNGDKATMDANKAALKDARAKLVSAHADLQTARKDAGEIVRGIKALRLDASATTSASIRQQ